MPLLQCSRCGRDISAMDKRCPACGAGISFWADVRYQIEHNRLYLAGVIVGAVLLLGVGWFLRMDSGVKWPLYAIIIVLAPLVPWLLKLVYQAAAPTPDMSPSGDGGTAVGTGEETRVSGDAPERKDSGQ